MISSKRTQRQRANGKGPYPADWTEIASRVKDAAGWRCERCGHPHETSIARVECNDRCTHVADSKQRMLTVHHLDMNPANCKPSNLVALCQSCHLSIQSRVDWLQSYMFDLPDWMEWRHKQVRRSLSVDASRKENESIRIGSRYRRQT